MASPKVYKAGETCRPHRLTMPQRVMVAQRARVTPDSKTESSHRWPILQSHTSKVKDEDFLLMSPILPRNFQSLFTQEDEDEDSRRALAGNESSQSRDNIFRKVSMDSEEPEECQDLVLPSHQVLPSAAFRLKMRPRSFMEQPSELPPANSLAAQLLTAIDFPNTSTTASPTATPRQGRLSLPMSPPILKKLEVFDYGTPRECSAIPQDLLLPVF
jgi:hypothetical protein